VPASPAPRANRPRPVVLLILDGWGHRDDPADNAIALADVPNWRRLLAGHPTTLIHTEGRFVGLPDGQMGNSEVGHMNIGAGRIVYQDLTRIDAAIEDGSFFDNAELNAACDAALASGGTLHLMGLLSPGGVHSHEAHIFAMLELAARRGVPRVAVHAFLDGRDVPPKSGREDMRRFLADIAGMPGVRVATAPCSAPSSRPAYSRKPFQYAVMLPALPTGSTWMSGASPSASTISNAAVFCPCRR